MSFPMEILFCFLTFIRKQLWAEDDRSESPQTVYTEETPDSHSQALTPIENT